MVENLELSIGKRIKNYRKKLGFTIRDLASHCGLSANAISLIERGENSPTISSLKRLSVALGISLNELLEEEDNNPIVYIKNCQGMRMKHPKFEIESLGYGMPNQQLEPYCVTVRSGVDTSSRVISHPGQEFVYCLSGEIDYFIGGQQYKMKEGDSLLFDALSPHGWCNPNPEEVRLLLVFQSLDDAHLAHQRHVEVGLLD